MSAATVVVVALVLSACGGGDGSGTGSSDARYISGDGTVLSVPADQRQSPIDLVGTDPAGQRIDLATLRGKPVVLNVWGTWCPPCREEAKSVQAAYAQLQPGGVNFVGINTGRDRAPEIAAYEKTYGITYPSILDKSGGALLALRGSIPPKTVPATLVLDPAGRVAARVSGPVDTATLVGLVKDAGVVGEGTSG